ncbi:MAG: hypothetical protein SGJ02_01480 [bacterium]|nr:hypothetical protein [bacterium]
MIKYQNFLAIFGSLFIVVSYLPTEAFAITCEEYCTGNVDNRVPMTHSGSFINRCLYAGSHNICNANEAVGSVPLCTDRSDVYLCDSDDEDEIVDEGQDQAILDSFSSLASALSDRCLISDLVPETNKIKSTGKKAAQALKNFKSLFVNGGNVDMEEFDSIMDELKNVCDFD